MIIAEITLFNDTITRDLCWYNNFTNIWQFNVPCCIGLKNVLKTNWSQGGEGVTTYKIKGFFTESYLKSMSNLHNSMKFVYKVNSKF